MEEPTSDGEAAKEEPVGKEPPEEAPAAEERPAEKAESSKSEKAKNGGCCACCTPPGACLLSSLFTCLVAAALYYQLHMEIKEANELINKSLRGADAVAHALRQQEAGHLQAGRPNSIPPATTGAPRNDTVQPHSDATKPQRERPEEGMSREAGPRSTTEPQRKHQAEAAHEKAKPRSTTAPQRKHQEEAAHEKAKPRSTTEPQRKHQEAAANETAKLHSTTAPQRKHQEEGAHEKARPHSIGAQLEEDEEEEEGAGEATACHTATVTSHELCYHNVVWAKHKGIHEHPQWYPGLKESSEFEAFQEVLRIDPKMGCPRPCKDFSAAEDKTRTPTECHDTVLGERCFEHALWVMRVGLYQHPGWYPRLSNESNFAAFQGHLHDRGKGNCPKPCEQENV